MLGQTCKANTKGLRETFKPVNVKYPDGRAEGTFNSHLFGQIRDASDETENANQVPRIKDLGMPRAAV